MHDPLTSGCFDDALGHAHVIHVEVGRHQPMHVFEGKAESRQSVLQQLEFMGAIDAAVQQRQPPVPFEEIAIDGLGGWKGERQRDPVDALAERMGLRGSSLPRDARHG